MKPMMHFGLLLLVTLTCLPPSAEAFSRRSHTSEVTQNQAVTIPLRTDTNDGGDPSAKAVPEPPVLFLMSIALGAFALCSAVTRFRRVL
jgi:hypothetical protein